MREWRAYSIEDGESYGSIACEDEMTEEEAQAYAEELFGDEVYVALVSWF